MKIVLIVGESDAGKTTLIRSLSGMWIGANDHPNVRNARSLSWGPPPPQNMQTLIMASSLNEGNWYHVNANRVFTRGVRLAQANRPTQLIDTVAPWQLRQLLDLYDQRGTSTLCVRAILCINASVSERGWTVQDYQDEINNVGLGSHSVSHTISLFNGNYTGHGHQLINISGASHLAISQTGRPKRGPAPLTPAAVEAQARAHIHL